MRIVRVDDQCGTLTNEEYDYKGNLLRCSRQMAKVYQKAVDWSTGSVDLNGPLRTFYPSFDALNRIINNYRPNKRLQS
jgi:hypothetical protein